MPSDSSVKKSWRTKFYELKRPFNPEFDLKMEAQPSPNDIVMKHPENGANIRIKDNKTIMLFADENTGIKIDPNSGSIQHVSDKSIFQSEYINFNTANRGLRWNYQPFNNSLADPWRQVLTTLPGGARTFENLLLSPGAYVGAAGPVSPGTISGISAINLSNEQVIEGQKIINRAEIYTKGIRDSIKSIPMEVLPNGS